MTANTTVSIPAIFDLKQREVLWIDLNWTCNIAWGGANNVEANQKGMVLIGKTMTTMRKPTLKRLFSLHGKARGEFVSRPEIADTVFAVEQGITPFDGEAIAAKFLI